MAFNLQPKEAHKGHAFSGKFGDIVLKNKKLGECTPEEQEAIYNQKGLRLDVASGKKVPDQPFQKYFEEVPVTGSAKTKPVTPDPKS